MVSVAPNSVATHWFRDHDQARLGGHPQGGGRAKDNLPRVDETDTGSQKTAERKLADNLFRKQGQFWDVRFRGHPVDPTHVKDSKGMTYLWYMLQQEHGKSVPALELIRL